MTKYAGNETRKKSKIFQSNIPSVKIHVFFCSYNFFLAFIFFILYPIIFYHSEHIKKTRYVAKIHFTPTQAKYGFLNENNHYLFLSFAFDVSFLFTFIFDICSRNSYSLSFWSRNSYSLSFISFSSSKFL